MRRILFVIFVFSAILYCSSCSRGISIHEAASGKAKCNRYIK